MKKKIKVVVKEVGKGPEVREVENDLGTFQTIVGGDIQFVPHRGFDVPHSLVAYVDEEGRIKEKPFNVRGLCGTILVVDNTEEDSEGLTDAEVEEAFKWLGS